MAENTRSTIAAPTLGNDQAFAKANVLKLATTTLSFFKNDCECKQDVTAAVGNMYECGD